MKRFDPKSSLYWPPIPKALMTNLEYSLFIL